MNPSSQIKRPRGSVLKRTQLSSLTKFRSQLQNEQQPQPFSNVSSRSNLPNITEQEPPKQRARVQQSFNDKLVKTRNRTRQNVKTNNNNNHKMDPESLSVSGSSCGQSRDHSLTRNNRNNINNRRRRRGDNNNMNKENIRTTATRRRDTARPKSRTRNNGYKKPMTLNEAKQKVKQLRQQLNEVNEAYDRLVGEKEDLDDELNEIHEKNAFDLEQKTKKINELQRDKIKIENEFNLNQQQLQHLQSQIKFKDQQIQMGQSAKNALDQQLMTLTQSIKMKDDMLNNNKTEINMIKQQNSMLNEQCQRQQHEIQGLNNNVSKLRMECNSNQNEIKELKSEMMTLSLKNSSLSNQNESQFRKIQELNQNVNKLNEELSFNQQRMQTMQRDFNSISQQKEILENECQSQSNTIYQQSQKIKEMEEKCEWYEQKARKDEEVRKRLHNTIQELKGNIRVFCRVRPLLDESKNNDFKVYEFDNEDIENQQVTLLTQPTISTTGISGKLNEGKKYNFDFDRVFRPFATQETVFSEISQLVQSALDGYKVCIFAYGQTGSGKTFTMEGPSLNKDDINRGMIPRSVEKIFEHKEKLKEKGWTYKCMATYLEIYNEKIRDLLTKPGANNNEKYLEIHQKKSNNKGSKTEVYVEGLTEIEVNSSFDVYPLLTLASKNRSVGRTDCNERSSRSHSVFQLFLNGYNEITQQSTFGVLNLIDLAGSERLKKSNATGIQLKETQNINKSLSCLGDVIAALSKGGKSHIPYRNSKLTYLLMNYFGGDAKTLMFVNLCPEKDRIDESLCSLRFAAKVNDCQIGIAKRTT